MRAFLRHSRAAALVVLLATILLSGCGEEAPARPAGSADAGATQLRKMTEIAETEACKLIPVGRIEKAFGKPVDDVVPFRNPTGKMVVLTCSYFLDVPPSDGGLVSLSVRYHYVSDRSLDHYVARMAIPGMVGQRIEGPGDATVYYLESGPAGSPGADSTLHAFTKFADGLRTVGVTAPGKATVAELEPLARELLDALDGQQD